MPWFVTFANFHGVNPLMIILREDVHITKEQMEGHGHSGLLLVSSQRDVDHSTVQGGAGDLCYTCSLIPPISFR